MAESSIVCPNVDCDGQIMARTSSTDVPDQTGTLALYKCSSCGRLGAIILNAEAGMSQHGQSWIENELRTNGFIFPSDTTGSGGGSGRFGR